MHLNIAIELVQINVSEQLAGEVAEWYPFPDGYAKAINDILK